MSALTPVDEPQGASERLLTPEAARTLTDRIRGALEAVHALLETAWHGRAWEALGYATWEAYCRVEFAQARMIRLPRAGRREVVAGMHERGMSARAIGAGMGLADQTVRADLRLVRGDVVDGEIVGQAGEGVPGTVQELPDAVRAAGALPVGGLERGTRGTDRVVALAVAAGQDGITWLDVVEALGWHQGQATGALSRLHAAQRLTRDGDRRGRGVVYRALPQLVEVGGADVVEVGDVADVVVPSGRHLPGTLLAAAAHDGDAEHGCG